MNPNFLEDIRDVLFSEIMHQKFSAAVSVEAGGIIAGSKAALAKLTHLGLATDYLAPDGTEVEPGDVVIRFSGTPKQITSAEDLVIGNLMKTSGIATRARQAVRLAEGKIRVVSGAWKKMPPEIKQQVREAIMIGGAFFRIVDVPFVYLDKNYVRIFGSITGALRSAAPLADSCKVIQLKGEIKTIAEEAKEAAAAGAQVLMVDTGRIADVKVVNQVLDQLRIRNEKQVAFAGGIKIAEIPDYFGLRIDILDIGAQIVDAPLLDMKMDVIN